MPAAALLASPLIFELNIVTSYLYLLNDNAVTKPVIPDPITAIVLVICLLMSQYLC